MESPDGGDDDGWYYNSALEQPRENGLVRKLQDVAWSPRSFTSGRSRARLQ
jgi:hypothetical protein